ncbi:MAG: tetratricopeptide repeat protein [Gemmatimonas sp.]|nr:tetratricopeptide repeat protein [Gemmatimonas sp.]
MYRPASWGFPILARRRERFGDPHRDVALAMQWLGLVLTDKGDFAASEAYLRQALAMQRDMLGDVHQDVAVSLFGLGLLAMEQGRYREAVPWLEESIAMTRQVLGENHVDTALHMQILGEAYRLMGNYERSETFLRDALRRNRQVLNAPHKRLGNILVSLGRTLSAAGELEAAKATLEEALEMFQREGISRQRGRLEALVAYGEVLTRTGQPEEAEPLLREAVSVLTEKIVAPHNRYVIYARAALGNCLAAQHRYGEAEPILLKVFTTYRDHYGPSDPRTQTARTYLADLYAAWGKRVEARPYRARPPAVTAVAVLPSTRTTAPARPDRPSTCPTRPHTVPAVCASSGRVSPASAISAKAPASDTQSSNASTAVGSPAVVRTGPLLASFVARS